VARKHIATIHWRRPWVTAELRWRPVHKGVPGDEKADEWAKPAADEPDAHGVGHLRPGRCSDQLGQRRQPSWSLAHLKRSITEVKWQAATAGAESEATGKKYGYSRLRGPCQKPGSGPTNANKGLAARFYQLKMGHCLTGQYLMWTKRFPTAKCCWCPYRAWTQEHLFKCCPHWKRQQKILWAEGRWETGRGKDRLKIRDFITDEQCRQAILDCLATTDVGRLAPKPAGEV